VNRAERIQSYFRVAARRVYDAFPVPPFTVFVHPEDALIYFNYAVPDEPVSVDVGDRLELLRAEFARRERVPRFEYVEGFAPELALALERAGFELELRAPLMTCRPPGLRHGDDVPGLEIRAIDESSPLELIRDSITIARRAFGSDSEKAATPAEAKDHRRRFGASRTTLVGLLDGEPVAVATAVAQVDGLSEVAGVGVLERARRRGIGAAMTAAATAAAFAGGAELAVLAPGDEGAMRIYERAGFEPVETMLHYVDAR
jgi:GNAT superfamily N-acetyltransferase